MIARRDMLGTTGLAGLFGAIAPGSAPADPQQPSERAIADIADAVTELRKTIAKEREFPELTAIREPIRNYLRATSKYPDFIDVGTDVWQTIYDWHIRWHQPVSVARDANGRYIMSVMFTTVVLRPDTVPNYIGTPYDSK
jgi:hypothetical protein